jgi:hypothetical protein
MAGACTKTAGKLHGMITELIIPSRFNGPPESGNGGYSCGVLAACIEGPARVRLHVPPPLDRPMAVRPSAGDGVELLDGETLVGTALPAPFDLEVPKAPTLEQARDAMSRYPCYEGHVFPTCFVCGPGRPAHDGLEIFPGPVKDWNLLASAWTPGKDLLDAKGFVKPEIVWSALDCPGYFACMGKRPRPGVLGELQLEITANVPGGDALVVFAWPLGRDGRKLYGGTALATAEGEVLACARSTWILLKT